MKHAQREKVVSPLAAKHADSHKLSALKIYPPGGNNCNTKGDSFIWTQSLVLHGYGRGVIRCPSAVPTGEKCPKVGYTALSL